MSTSSEDADKRQVEAETEVAAIFDGTITFIASIRCYGFGEGSHRRRCSHHINLSPARPEESLTIPQARQFARQRGWEQRQREGARIWLCPDCLDCF